MRRLGVSAFVPAGGWSDLLTTHGELVGSLACVLGEQAAPVSLHFPLLARYKVLEEVVERRSALLAEACREVGSVF